MNTTVAKLASALDQAAHLHHPTHISVLGFGSISVYPRQRVYASDITDWESLSGGDAPIQVNGSVWAVPPAGSLPIAELQWRTSVASASAFRGKRSLPLMVRLAFWPDLSEVPQELCAPLARICALLTRKPTAVVLLSRLVALPVETTEALVEVLLKFGHLAPALSSDGPAATSREGMPVDEDAARGASQPSILSRLWTRLSLGM